MAKPPSDIVLATFECPACHEEVNVYAAMAIKTESKTPGLFEAGYRKLGVKVIFQGVSVFHDCRRDLDADAG